MLNQQGLFEDDEQELCGGTGLFSCLPQSISTNIQQPIFHLNSLKTLTSSVTSTSNYPLTLLPQQNTPGIFFSYAANQKDTGDMPSHFHRSTTTNPWEWRETNDCKQISNRAGEALLDDCSGVGGGVHRHNNHHRIGISAVKMKKMKPMSSGGRRKVREPRFCFKTMSDVDVLDDGYKWRKYGQKVVKNTHHPRSYYRCTQDNCRVKKRVERLAEDPRMVITSYEGRHVHSPSHDEDDSQSPSRLNNFFW